MATSSISQSASTIPRLKESKIGTVFLITVAILVGVWFSPVVIGFAFGYTLGYYFVLKKQYAYPTLWPLPRSIRGHILTVVIFFSAPVFLGMYFFEEWADAHFINMFTQPGMVITGRAPAIGSILIIIFNLGSTSLTIMVFEKWRKKKMKEVAEQLRHGSARFALRSEMKAYTRARKTRGGIYIGGGDHFYNRQGHILSVAGTRSGKGTSLIIPNLLGAGNLEASWVVVDPKGENAAITARYQKERGKQVRILNPWGLHNLETCTYNPLDLINNPDSENLPDDAQIIAQMIVPSLPGKDDHWNNRARSLITGILMHLATSQHELTLSELWRLLRLPQDDWLELLREMALNEHPVSGPIINGTAHEILSILENSEKEATGIISTAQRWTDVFKSIPLRRSLQSSDFDINELADGKTMLYVIIPADKLKTHYAWLRLVVTTAMKAVIRKPKKQVVFCLDEFYALGYIQEIEIALGAYAGFNITVWAILQSLVQLQDLYGKNWENFIGNSSVIQAFGMNDNTTAQYFSNMAGQMSVPTFVKNGSETIPHGSSPRNLITPDEARRLGDQMLVFIDHSPPALVRKLPYYNHPVWRKRADPNPYYEGN